MSVTIIIPARYASSRLPGKPLLAETGKTLIRHVVEAAGASKLARDVVVATDDERIAAEVASFGGRAVMTGADCASGTDRLAEAARILELDDDEIVVNVQGDEPEMPGECVDRLVELIDDGDADIATLATPISAQEAQLPNMTKVVLDQAGHAMYFSRAKIPADRDSVGGVEYLLHHGIYAYRVSTLRRYAELGQTPAEQAEKLEQLRALEHGWSIVVGVVDYRGARIDTPQEYADFVSRTAGR